MKSYVKKRFIQLIVILFGITFLSFSLMRVAGSDIITQKYERAGIVVTQEIIDEQRQGLGLDQPFIIQYLSWLQKLLCGDMGESFVTGEKVFSMFTSKLPATFLLAIISIILTVFISVPLGILSAVKKNTFIDYLVRVISFLGNSMPNFFVALLLIYLFAIKMQIFPVIAKDMSISSAFLPALTLTIAMSAKYLRQIRAVVLDELDKAYVIGAKSRGISFSIILFNNVLRVTLVTIITLLALSIGSLLGGTAIIESIFMWDGVGKLAVDSIGMRDYPVIQAYVLWMAIIYVGINLIADILYGIIDPRIRLLGESK